MENFYKQVDAIITTHALLYDKAMKAMQFMGYNGFKRMYRCLTKEFWCYHVDLENELFNKYRQVLDTNLQDFNYKPANLKEHLTYMDTKLLQDIQELGKLNKQYMEQTGFECGLIKSVVGCMLHDYEKSGRWLKRFDESQWNRHDIAYVDDYLHAKYKAKEGG